MPSGKMIYDSNKVKRQKISYKPESECELLKEGYLEGISKGKI